MWPNPQFPVDLITFTEEILNEKFHFFVERYGQRVELKLCLSWICVLQIWHKYEYVNIKKSEINHTNTG